MAYRRLNMWHVNCGATYVWGGRAISPYFGWMTGWVIILAYFLGATSIAYPIGPYALSLVSNRWEDSTVAAALIGAIAIVLVTAVAYVGISATSRLQGLLIVIEYVAITIVGILGLIGHLRRRLALGGVRLELVLVEHARRRHRLREREPDRRLHVQRVGHRDPAERGDARTRGSIRAEP